MKATVLFRISAIVLLLFAAGHSFGFLTFRPPTREGLAVLDAMTNVHFTVGGQTFSYGGFYRGFGLSATVSMLFEAFIAWHLGNVARRNPREVTAIGWALAIQQIAGLVLSCMYFAIVPALFSLVLIVCLAAATWLATSRSAINQHR